MLFFCNATHIEQSIAHTTKSCIDAHARDVSNFLKTEILIKTHIYDFTLIIWQSIYETAHISKGLFVYHLRFNIIVAEVCII